MLARAHELASAILAWFVPRELEEADPEDAARARLLTISALTILVLHTLVAIDFFTLPVRSRATEVSMVVLAAVYVSVPFVLHYTRSTAIAGAVAVMGLIGFLAFIAYDNGGFEPAVLPWACTVPLIATFFVGPRLGLISAVLVTFVLVTFYKMEQLGYTFPSPAFPEARKWFTLIAGVTATGFIALLGMLHERSRRAALDLANRRLEELQTLNAKLTKLWDDARAGSLAKTEFIANVSHELRTPMNGVIGMAGLLLDTPLTGEQRDYAETIVSSAQSLLLLINELLDTAKIEAGKLELNVTDFDLPQCIEDTMSLLAERAHSKDVELAYLLNPEVPAWVEGDPVRLRQIITNLVHNAIKFTEKGEVSLTVSLENHNDPTSRVRFEVRDTGIGIAEAVQKRLFEPFMQADTSTTRRYGGTGLGLAIAKNLVELMGGEIGFESKPGHGSLFWFTVHFENQFSGKEDSLSLVSVLLGRRALVVDDNETARKMITLQLSSLGFSVDAVGGGKDALACLEEGQRQGTPHHIVIADVAMPEMDGLALVRAIKGHASLSYLPVVLLSPLSRAAKRKEAIAAGAAAYVAKPVRRLQLADRVAAALSVRSADDSNPNLRVVSSPAWMPAKKRILLVEDNEVSAKVGIRQLQKLGYDVDAAGSGREAVAAVAGSDYDAVLMDCQMPDLDGFEATRQIRRLEGDAKRTVIIAMTAGAMVGDREKCLRAGMDDFLAKPVRLEELRESLFRWTLPKEPSGPAAQAPLSIPPLRSPSFMSLPPLMPQSPPLPAPVSPVPPIPVAVAVMPPVPGELPEGSKDALDSMTVDMAALERLKALVSKDEPNLVGELIEIFLRDARASCTQLHDAAVRRDRQTVEYQAHKLVSGCVNLGARRMARLCRELEEQAKKDENGELAPYVEKIEQEFALVCEAFAEQRSLLAQ